MANHMKRNYRRLDWEQWLSLAAEYYRTNGDLLIDRSYMVSGYRLGRWIERQRAMYNGVLNSTLNEKRIAALEAIGMVWKLEYRSPWDCWMEQVQLYYEEYGDICVPKNYKSGNYCLGNWIAMQRKKYAKGLLTEEQIAELQAYGMSWSEGERRAWDEWYRDAKAYYAANGDLLVPIAYTTKEGRLLGQWIAVQRERKRGEHNRTPITKKQIALLGKLDMVWSLQEVRDSAWDSMYASVSAYMEQNGRLPLWPRNLKAPDGRSMPNWIGIQRTRLSEKKCPKEQAERLMLIGIYPWKAGETAGA